ncbi:hypothetical protein Dimus_008298, partial [Dionaea muscipula]
MVVVIKVAVEQAMVLTAEQAMDGYAAEQDGNDESPAVVEDEDAEQAEVEDDDRAGKTKLNWDQFHVAHDHAVDVATDVVGEAAKAAEAEDAQVPTAITADVDEVFEVVDEVIVEIAKAAAAATIKED